MAGNHEEEAPAAAAAPAPAPAAVSPAGDDEEAGLITLNISHRKVKHDLVLPASATVTDLAREIEAALGIPLANQKILVPRGAMLKAPFKDPEMPARALAGKALMLVGSEAARVEAVEDMAAKVERRNAAVREQRARARASNKPFSSSSSSQHRKPQGGISGISGGGSSDADKYTFAQVRPLQNLPHPERSQALLERLKQDRGIRLAMQKHKFSVALLTEMEPLANTQSNHEGTSRLLGLNRNRGEVIELRLRTDAHDGYRDYRTVRRTLCHELAHNVHSDHDRAFWDLCHQIEREVDRYDWDTTGRRMGDLSTQSVWGEEDEEHEDAGGWTGGEFTLGGVVSTAGLSRREILGNAAAERQRKDAESEQKAEKGWRPCQKKQ